MSGSNRFKRHVVALLVSSPVAGTRAEVQNSVKRWAEHHGHTSLDFGFEILDAGRVTVRFSSAAKPALGEVADEEES
jgi:hypothetical protein